MAETKTQVATVAPTAVAQAATPFELIAHAVQSGQMDVETVKELVALQREMKADAAREAFVKAMAAFQSKCPTVDKTKKVLNKDGTVRWQYAPLDKIVEAVRPMLEENGLAYTIQAAQDDKSVAVTCIITHVLGHSESSSFTTPIDKEGYMTAPQKVASALTYGKRQAFCNALGILTGDEDTDATDVGKDKKPRDIKSEIIFLYRALGFDAQKSLAATETKTKELTQLDLIPENFDEIRNRLEVLVAERNADNSKA